MAAIEPNGKRANDFSIDVVAKENVYQTFEQISNFDPILSVTVETGKIKIIGGFFDLDTRQVEIF